MKGIFCGLKGLVDHMYKPDAKLIFKIKGGNAGSSSTAKTKGGKCSVLRDQRGGVCSVNSSIWKAHLGTF